MSELKQELSQFHLRACQQQHQSEQVKRGKSAQLSHLESESKATLLLLLKPPREQQIQPSQVNRSRVQSESDDFRITLTARIPLIAQQSSNVLARAKFRCAAGRCAARSCLSLLVILSVAIQFMVALSRDQVGASRLLSSVSSSPSADPAPSRQLSGAGALATKCHRWSRRSRLLEWLLLAEQQARLVGLQVLAEPRLASSRRRRSSKRELANHNRAKLATLAELLLPAASALGAPDELEESVNPSASSAKLEPEDEQLASSTSSADEQPAEQDDAEAEQPASSCRRLADIKSEIPSISIRIVFFSLYGLIFAIGLVGNALTLYAMRRKRRDRFSVIDIFIANLALSDIMLCLFAVPITPIYSLYHGYWVFGPILCKALAFAQGSSVYISTFTMISIAHLRYQLIVHPLSDSMSKLTAFLLNLLTWILGFLVTLPYLMHVGLLPENCSIKFCDESWDHEIDRFWFSVITIILQFCLPFIAVSFFYGSIFWKLRQQRNLRRHRQPNKSHKHKPAVADQLAGKSSLAPDCRPFIITSLGSCWRACDSIRRIRVIA